MQGISKRAFAKLMGVSDMAVRKAEKTGRVVLFSDGAVDEARSRAAWGRNVDPVRQPVRTATGKGSRGSRRKAAAPADADPSPVKDEAEALDAVQLVKRVLQQEGGESASVVDFGMARTAESILKSRERELKLAERRKELVPVAQVRSHITKAFIGFRQAVQRIPARHAAAIAAELGVDTGKLDKALTKAIQIELEAMAAPVVRV